MGISLISGRYFDTRDSDTAAPVAIIDETMARTYWPNEDPIGKRIKRGGMGSAPPWMTIRRVGRHVRFRTPEARPPRQLYWPPAPRPPKFLGPPPPRAARPRRPAPPVPETPAAPE